MLKSLYLILLSISLFSCISETPVLELKSKNNTVNLIEQVPGNWQKVCILIPYTSPDRGEILTGIKSSIIQKTGIESSDTFYIFTFINADKSHTIYKVLTSNILLGYPDAKCFQRAASNLKTLNKLLNQNATSVAPVK